MFLRQVRMITCRFVPSIVKSSVSKVGVHNSAPLKLCWSITPPPQCWTPMCSQLIHSCHCHHETHEVGLLSVKVQSIGCRKYATSSTTKDQPQRRVYKLMKIKAKDFEKVDPDTYFDGLEPTMVQANFEQSRELEDANDMVKKLFSLEVANQKQITEKQIQVLNEQVQLDPDTENAYAKLVVKMTVLIRAYSRRLQTYIHRKDVGAKEKLVHLIDKRRKILKFLRKQNFAQFEKVKKELGIDWVPFGRYDYFPQTKRMREKEGIMKVAYRQKQAALKEYMKTVRLPQMKLEIAQLKKDLGQELTEEEQEMLRESEDIADNKQ